MSPREFDFESFWDDLKAKKKAPAGPETIQVISGRAADLDDMLEVACAKTAQDLMQKYQQHRGQNLTVETLADIVTTGVRTFMERWHESLRGQNLAGLIEFVLEGQSLTPAEMTGFVQALPRSLLERITRSAVGSASGIHSLMAVEYGRRLGNVQHYTLRPDQGHVLVEFLTSEDQKVSFRLDEDIELTESGVVTGVSEETEQQSA